MLSTTRVIKLSYASDSGEDGATFCLENTPRAGPWRVRSVTHLSCSRHLSRISRNSIYRRLQIPSSAQAIQWRGSTYLLRLRSPALLSLVRHHRERYCDAYGSVIQGHIGRLIYAQSLTLMGLRVSLSFGRL